jgi:hypothetical protein
MLLEKKDVKFYDWIAVLAVSMAVAARAQGLERVTS